MLSSFDGHEPEIAESGYVADSAVVIGEVTIEAEANVWPNAVLHGDHGHIVLREGANVQDNATLHDGAEVGPYATVGHNAVFNGATTQRRSMVGTGAVVLNQATVGEESLIGANSLVTEETTLRIPFSPFDRRPRPPKRKKIRPGPKQATGTSSSLPHTGRHRKSWIE